MFGEGVVVRLGEGVVDGLLGRQLAPAVDEQLPHQLQHLVHGALGVVGDGELGQGGAPPRPRG